MLLKIDKEYIINGFDEDFDFKNCVKKEFDKKYEDVINEFPELELKAHEPIQNILRYKTMYKLGFTKFDCDCSQAMKFIYKTLWPDDWESGEYQGDTINSFWTTFKEYIKVFHSTDFDLDEKRCIKKEYITKYTKKYTERYNKNISDNTLLWSIHILEMLDTNNIAFADEIKTFAKLSHTLGNFTLVPDGFNTGRVPKTKDYWDLTLYHLKQNDNKDEIWNKAHNFYNQSGIIKKYFLDSYFIEDNIKNKKIEDLNVKFFFDRHLENILPGQKLNLSDKSQEAVAMNELKNCISAMNDNIEKRAKKMIEDLKIHLAF